MKFVSLVLANVVPEVRATDVVGRGIAPGITSSGALAGKSAQRGPTAGRGTAGSFVGRWRCPVDGFRVLTKCTLTVAQRQKGAP